MKDTLEKRIICAETWKTWIHSGFTALVFPQVLPEINPKVTQINKINNCEAILGNNVLKWVSKSSLRDNILQTYLKFCWHPKDGLCPIIMFSSLYWNVAELSYGSVTVCSLPSGVTVTTVLSPVGATKALSLPSLSRSTVIVLFRISTTPGNQTVENSWNSLSVSKNVFSVS